MENGPDSNRCGIGIRGIAMGIDSIDWFANFLVAGSVVGALTSQTVASGSEISLSGAPAYGALTLWLGLPLGIHTLLEWKTGKTFGKYLVSIRVVPEKGNSLSLRDGTVRNVARIIDWLPLFYLLGIILLVVDGKNRRLGDRLAGTAVIQA